MRTAIHFQKIIKKFHGMPSLRIEDLRIYERETVAFYGLSQEYNEGIVNQMTGVYPPDEGTIKISGTDYSGFSDEKAWFRYLEDFGIYNAQPVFQEGSSIGENVAMLYRLRNDLIEEPQLSASVLKLANLVQLTITDLSKMMSEAGVSLRMKVRLSRALAYRPKVVILLDPTNELSSDIAVKLVELVKRARRKLRFTLVLFSSDIWFVQQLSDRVIFLSPQDGFFIENQLRGWYHKLFPFLNPSAAQLMQLSRDILHHSRFSKIRL
ncbi:MAG TPA: ATP-binding cassette domain-containing protein [Acidobacteriota bacterium]|nr:ATP-binding cassette domain-containing protein [Acidobacteriota bacterium]